MANTIVFVILSSLGVNSGWVYIPLYIVTAQELSQQAQILSPTTAVYFSFMSHLLHTTTFDPVKNEQKVLNTWSSLISNCSSKM